MTRTLPASVAEFYNPLLADSVRDLIRLVEKYGVEAGYSAKHVEAVVEYHAGLVNRAQIESLVKEK